MPFGDVFVDERRSATSWTTPYLFSAKERDEETGLTYFGARYYDSRTSVWLSVDPLAEKHPEISSYVYCANNPINLIDPDGRDWLKDKDGSYQYNPALNKNNASRILTDGQSYAFRSKVLNDKNGTANYRKDGSIMFSNETDAYNRMWDQANGYSSQREFGKKGREEMGMIKEDGVLVLPDWNNTPDGIDDYNKNFKEDLYGYKLKDGMYTDPVTGGNSSLVGTIHTHQDRSKKVLGPGYDDDNTFTVVTPNKPYLTIGYDKKIYGSIGSRNGKESFGHLLPEGYRTVNDLFKGAKLTKLLQRITIK